MSYRLRPYQQDAVDAVWRDWTAGERSVAIELPTGGGKTMVMADTARRIVERGGRVLLGAHREELVDQALRDLRLVMPAARLGRTQGPIKQTAGVDVAAGMIQTFATPGGLRAVDAGGFNCLMIDEAHHSAAPDRKSVV